MHHAEAYEFGVPQAGNHPQHAGLIAPLDLSLEADKAEMVGRERVLSQLHDRKRNPTGAGVGQADRLHRSESEGLAAAMGHHFDGQTPFEELRTVEVVHGGRLGRDECVVERLVLGLVHRAVQVVPLAIVHPAGRARG
jgi:hypothetical protein